MWWRRCSATEHDHNTTTEEGVKHIKNDPDENEQNSFYIKHTQPINNNNNNEKSNQQRSGTTILAMLIALDTTHHIVVHISGMLRPEANLLRVDHNDRHHHNQQ